MPTLPTNPTVQYVQRGHMTLSGAGTKDFVNIFHYRLTTPGSGMPSSVQIGNMIAAALTTAWKAALNTSYVQDISTIRFLDDTTDPEEPCDGLGTGVPSGDTLPPHAAVYFKLDTGYRGKFYRGSKHFGPILESQTAEQRLTNTGHGLWADLLTAMLTQLTDPAGGKWDLVIWSPSLSTIVGTTMTVAARNVLSTSEVRWSIGSMNRRKARSEYA